MAIYFLDLSAVVKRYFPEQGHNWVRILHESVRRSELYISQAAFIEVVASICRKAREQKTPTEIRDAIINTFRRGAWHTYGVRLVDETLYTAAGDLCRSHNLRSYDAIQLACAIAVRTEKEALEFELSESKLADFIFVSGDLKLLDIALAEGFKVENPNNYS